MTDRSPEPRFSEPVCGPELQSTTGPLPELSPPGEDPATVRPVGPRNRDVSPSAEASDGSTIRPASPSRTGPEKGGSRSGERFGDYELLEEVARGGMGVIFRARQVSLDRILAVKMILSGRLADDEDVRRFRQEAEAAAGLDHPGIVPVFEVGEYQGQHFFSMAFVDGESLSKRVARGPLPACEAAGLMQAVAEAIAYAHSRGVIHRDLKPGNILLGVDGRPRVTDFGIAKRVTGDSGLTATGQIVGTPSYMPPEQAAGRKEIGPCADVYALGAMLYALVVGRPPFQGATAVETINQVLQQEPVSLRQLNTGVPRDLETICLKCLEKDPVRRYASATDLAEDLRRFLEGRPILARPLGPLGRSWRWCRRNPSAASLGVLLLTASVALSIGLVLVNEARTTANRERLKAERAEQAMAQALERETQENLAKAAVLEALASATMRPVDQRGPALFLITQALVRQKNLAKAAHIADLLAQGAVTATDFYHAARGQALCVPLADKADKERHATRAVELLRQAIAKGFEGDAQLQEPDFAPLRQRADFRTLLEELRKQQ